MISSFGWLLSAPERRRNGEAKVGVRRACGLRMRDSKRTMSNGYGSMATLAQVRAAHSVHVADKNTDDV